MNNSIGLDISNLKECEVSKIRDFIIQYSHIIPEFDEELLEELRVNHVFRPNLFNMLEFISFRNYCNCYSNWKLILHYDSDMVKDINYPFNVNIIRGFNTEIPYSNIIVSHFLLDSIIYKGRVKFIYYKKEVTLVNPTLRLFLIATRTWILLDEDGIEYNPPRLRYFCGVNFLLKYPHTLEITYRDI